jgi:hypothetical protein
MDDAFDGTHVTDYVIVLVILSKSQFYANIV